MSLSRLVFGLLLVTGSAAPALAQDTSATPSDTPAASVPASAPDLDRDTLTIGVGAAIAPSYSGSRHYEVAPGGAVRGKFHGISFFTRGTNLLVDVIPSSSGPGWKLEGGPAANLDLNRTSRIHQDQVYALGKRKAALELGGFGAITRTGVITSDYDSLSARVSYVTDVTGVNHGYLITPSLEYSTPLSRKAYVGLSVSADYASGGYAHTYFDVPLDRVAASGLPAFSARKGWKDVSVGGLLAYSLTGDLLHGLSVVATGSYSRLQNSFADSPIVSQVGSRNQKFGALGLAYTF